MKYYVSWDEAEGQYNGANDRLIRACRQYAAQPHAGSYLDLKRALADHDETLAIWQNIRGTCRRCHKLLDRDFETGAHGTDRYCPCCWLVVTTEGEG